MVCCINCGKTEQNGVEIRYGNHDGELVVARHCPSCNSVQDIYNNHFFDIYNVFFFQPLSAQKPVS